MVEISFSAVPNRVPKAGSIKENEIVENVPSEERGEHIMSEKRVPVVSALTCTLADLSFRKRIKGTF
jgi:hypothetical protein